jgi:periodic tryptophan protein 2
MSVQFSPTGRTWSAASTEGIQVYSLDEALLFDPFELDIDITKENILKTLHDSHYLKALVVLHIPVMCH